MSNNEKKPLFRKKALDRISNPDQLTDYLHVAAPSVWLVMLAVIAMLTGVLAWSSIGTLKTYVNASVTVTDGYAEVVPVQSTELAAGMPVEVGNETYAIKLTFTDEYGHMIGYLEVTLPDGRYDGKILTEEVRPIDFLFESR
ncbi:MAG: hypothetical protein Q4C20_02960 [Erysipelotrichaceae bacterium]|jgi:hypothetical protein|nr:hypothetical protein [Erysipelotrichaceae bacterium]